MPSARDRARQRRTESDKSSRWSWAGASRLGVGSGRASSPGRSEKNMKIGIVGLIVASVGVTSCDDDDGGDGGASAFASGVAVKGPVADATVTVLALRPTGALGEVLGSGTTGTAGEFEVPISGYQGWAAVRVTGGTFTDEATGNASTIPDDEPLLGFADVQSTASDFAITPLTTIAFPLAQLFAHDPEATLADSVHNAFASLGTHFRLEDIGTVVPADLTAGPV